ncbi:MAG: beta-lactamase family protein [Saprospiraceae bacterium]|nr:beta-lactamase family protein [Saprospiraceae bacterium]
MKKKWILFTSVFSLAGFLIVQSVSNYSTLKEIPDCKSAESIVDPAFQDSIIKARNYLVALKDRKNIPGLSVAVGVGGKIVWAEGFGCADIEKGEPVTLETMFRVGSISKSMTSLALGKLYQEGKLDLGAPIQQYVPYFPEKKYPITVRQIAGHQSGIRHYRGLEMLSKKHYNSVKESVNKFQNRSLKFEPGTDYKYSSYGYVLLSAAIEGASGMPYLDYMQQEIFTPLNMIHTAADDNTKNITHRANYYKAKPGKLKPAADVDLSNKWAGGGYLSSPSDLVIMMQGVNKIITPETWKLLTTPQSYYNDDKEIKTDYGIGWREAMVASTGDRLIHHGGSSIGGRAMLLQIEQSGITVAICANSHSSLQKS